MNDLQRYLSGRQSEQPPQSLSHRLEVKVMNRIRSQHAPRLRYRLKLVTVGISAILLTLLWISFRSTDNLPVEALTYNNYNESIVILDDHQAILLTPLSNGSQPGGHR